MWKVHLIMPVKYYMFNWFFAMLWNINILIFMSLMHCTLVFSILLIHSNQSVTLINPFELWPPVWVSLSFFWVEWGLMLQTWLWKDGGKKWKRRRRGSKKLSGSSSIVACSCHWLHGERRRIWGGGGGKQEFVAMSYSIRVLVFTFENSG